MNILYISQYYPPEMGAPSARVYELAHHWSTMGEQVTVLTGFPNHPTGKLDPEYRARWRGLVAREHGDGGVELVRTWLWPRPNRGYLDRLLNYGSFMFSAAITGFFLAEHDVVIGTSPQLLVGLAAWWVARAKGSHFIFEVRDLWPESLVAVGASSQKSWMMSVLGTIAGFLYRHADRIVVVSPAFREHLVAHWGVPVEKIEVIENGVELDRFSENVNIGKVRDDLGLGAGPVVSYIGTLGMAHGIETVLAAAEKISASDPDVQFLLLGEGAAKDEIAEQIAERGLLNVRLHDSVPREQVPAVIAASDICLVLLRRSDIFRTVIPTKMLEFMAAGRAVVLGVEGQAKSLLEEAGAGIAIPPEDADALAAAVHQLVREPALRARFGKNGRQYSLERLSRRTTAEKYFSLMKKMDSSQE